MKPPRRLFRRHVREPEVDPLVTVSVPSTFKTKPVLLTEPRMKDLAAYNGEMMAALEDGYKRGLVEPCVLVIWRGSRYAREHGLDRTGSPLTFRPISGPELCTL